MKSPGLIRDFLFLVMLLLISLLFTLLPVALGMAILYLYLKIEQNNAYGANWVIPRNLLKTSVLLVGLGLISFGISNLYLNKFKELFIQ